MATWEKVAATDGEAFYRGELAQFIVKCEDGYVAASDSLRDGQAAGF